MPFRELEVHDAFMLNGHECDKVGTDKYLTYDDLFEPVSLETADPNMMVELVEEEGHDEDAIEEEREFFHKLLNFFEIMKQMGEEMSIRNLRQFAKDFLQTPKD